ncbi:hypothetical protein STSP2_00360 [Anaerohalosphaera lusitana]|uniref:YicC-like family, N-terminal region n=1 Tax=Anaerohalosphaera lusitana TaxID=1936003 RepID=A0A1U9NHG7_9BACT|nr:YicC/YloC family endoribonuclease [Anaerohalosphaera lusitana]AQT67217.1 hypothetical protein STSP2_00360 [Anaerohalosphaera lusitana]
MINSMTGFGEAARELDGVIYTAELKSVNNRHLKTHVKLPDIVGFLADDIDKLLRAELRRGTVNFWIHAQNVAGEGLYDLDERVLENYITKIRSVAERSGSGGSFNVADLVTLPGVVKPVVPDEQQEQRLRETVMDIANQAVQKLEKMRQVEGKALEDDLLANCAAITDRCSQIDSRSDEVLKAYHEKLQKRVEELLSGSNFKLDEEMIAREVAIFAERSDIAEELTRLDSHIKQFEKCCKEVEHCGRRLDFLSQEMLREANTIASKASDAQVSQLVVDIKCMIDRIKEQVQNVE